MDSLLPKVNKKKYKNTKQSLRRYVNHMTRYVDRNTATDLHLAPCNSSCKEDVHIPAWFELHWVRPSWWRRRAVDFFNQLSSNFLFWQHLCLIVSHFVFHSNEIKKREVRFLRIS